MRFLQGRSVPGVVSSPRSIPGKTFAGMKIDLYTVCWNEGRMLPFFFRHYDPLVSRYVVFDDGSTDGSRRLLREHPKVDLRPFRRTDPDSFVESERDLFENCWKESRGRADWVILVNVDEHLHHPELPAYLRQSRDDGITVIPATGYQMIARAFPESRAPLTALVRTGIRWERMDKTCVFDPDAIEQPGFDHGRHSAQPRGAVRMPERKELALLHYKYLGVDYLVRRLEGLRPGFGAGDRARNLGHKYFWSRTEAVADFEAVWAAAHEVLSVDGVVSEILSTV